MVKGDLEGIHISNLKMHNMDNPFIFELHKGNNATDIVVKNVIADSVRDPIAVHSDAGYSYRNILFKNLSIYYITGITTEAPWVLGAMNLQQLRLENVKFYANASKPSTAVKSENISFPSLINTNIYNMNNTRGIEMVIVETLRLRTNLPDITSKNRQFVKAKEIYLIFTGAYLFNELKFGLFY